MRANCLKVHETSQLQLHPVKDNLITNIKTDDDAVGTFSIELDGRSRHHRDNCANLLVPSDAFAAALPFTCALLPGASTDTMGIGQVFDVAAKYVDGKPFCQISVKQLSRNSLERLSTSDMLLSLHVALRGKEEVSDSIQLRVVPAFYIKKNDIDLSSDKPFDTFSISGVPEQLNSLIVQSDDPWFVEIQRMFTPAEKRTADYKVQLLEKGVKRLENTTIVIRSGLTGQIKKLPISVLITPSKEQPRLKPTVKLEANQNRDAIEPPTILTERFYWLILYTLIIALIIVLIFGYRLILPHRIPVNTTHDLTYQYAAVSPYQSPYAGTPPYARTPSSQFTPGSGHDRSSSPTSERRSFSGYQDPVRTTPGNRTLFSVGQ